MVLLLDAPLTWDEFHNALKQMASGRSLGPDGLTSEFFLCFWDLFGEEFMTMIHMSTTHGCFPTGMT